MINFAREKYPEARFELKNILIENITEDFDYIFISGTFNDSTGNNWDWMRECLIKLFPHAKIALAFNNLSTYVDYFDDHLFYIKPEKVFILPEFNMQEK